jgi:hypothetical protein
VKAPLAPQNLGAEESVLGAIMLAGADGLEASSATVAAVRETGLEPGDFYRDSHELVYQAALDVDGRAEPTDVLTIETELRARRRLTAAGGAARLQELAALAPSVANAGHFAELVAEAAARREQVHVALAMKAEAENGGGLSADLLERIERVLRGRRLGVKAALARVVTLEKFAAVQESGAAAILGTVDNALISEDADVMTYGDGGVGKTSLMLDLGFHLAAGDDWLGIPVPRPLRVLLIENEGPRPPFRRKLKRKLGAWVGSLLGDRLLVLEEPWGQFSFADPRWRQLLAETIREREVDVVIVGPLTASGMDLPGTLQECREFLGLVADVRAASGRSFACLLVHHENRGGRVSGAWEGAGDTLLHVQQQGRGHVRLYVQKARWSSEQHGTTLQLTWATGEGFELAEGEPPRPERVWGDIETFVLEYGGCAWNEVDAAVPGQRGYLTRRRDQMLADGTIINAGTTRRFELWHRDDPARRTLDASGSEAGTAAEPPDSDPGGEPDLRAGSPFPARGEPAPGTPPAERGEANQTGTDSEIPSLRGEPSGEPVHTTQRDDRGSDASALRDADPSRPTDAAGRRRGRSTT